ncbi:MAG: Tol-Pal system beta propeller repeat protein TolB [Candidatus Aminicenantes bacterium]|nr:Tol-Pal system beta propeller repeat protein TolB [Candidatus Aminicenantes bacterium]
MKRSAKIAIIFFGYFLIALILLTNNLVPQQEVVLKITEGVPAISLALPKFIIHSDNNECQQAASEIYEVLSADLKYSRVFQLLPQSYYSYIRPLDPKNIFFKDWESIQARVLVVGEISGNSENLIFEAKLYDVRSAKFIVGRKYQGNQASRREMAHRLANEIMKAFGEKPIFTSKIVFVSDRDGNDELYLMDYDGANQIRLTFNRVRDYMPAIAPDAQKIAFTSYRETVAGLYLMDLTKKKIIPISTNGTNFAAAFSPDGKKLAFCSTMDGNAEIYVATLGENGIQSVKRLTFNEAIDTAPCFSPTGREIAFVSDRGGTPQIYIMDAEGSNVRRVSFGGTYHDAPAWSPDGERIVYVSRLDNIFDLYVLNLRTNQIIKLTESNARHESPCWSPDGRHIVFSSNLSGQIQIFSIDYDGTNLRRLTSQGNNKLPDWSN